MIDAVSDSLVISAYPGSDCAELTRRIDTLTYRQVRDLNVIQNPQKVVLRGCSKSYYIKQLASQAVVDLLPGTAVENCIDVRA